MNYHQPSAFVKNERVWISSKRCCGTVSYNEGGYVYVMPDNSNIYYGCRGWELSKVEYSLGQRVRLPSYNIYGVIRSIFQGKQYNILGDNAKYYTVREVEMEPATGRNITLSTTTSAASTASYDYNRTRYLSVGDLVRLNEGSTVGKIVARQGKELTVRFPNYDSPIKTTPDDVKYISNDEFGKMRMRVGASWIEDDKRVHKVLSIQSLVHKLKSSKLESLRAVLLYNKVVYPGAEVPTEEDLDKFNSILGTLENAS